MRNTGESSNPAFSIQVHILLLVVKLASAKCHKMPQIRRRADCAVPPPPDLDSPRQFAIEDAF